MLTITQAKSREQIGAARILFREYEAWLGLDICLYGFEDEMAGLPGKYAAPDGRLYLAYNNSQPAGCIALRKIDDEICEMKRLFVREAFRGQNIGLKLIGELVSDAKRIGYFTMRLDTYPSRMKKAVGLCESLGFRPIAPYYEDWSDGVLFMELSLIDR
jgi:GNAT superfamily N-acetyltransferase